MVLLNALTACNRCRIATGALDNLFIIRHTCITCKRWTR